MKKFNSDEERTVWYKELAKEYPFLIPASAWTGKIDNQSEKSLVEKRKKGFEKYEEAGKKIVFDEDKVEYWRKLAKSTIIFT